MNLPKKIIQLTYDPKTQLGMVLRLRSRLGDHFELRFQPIGVNGKGKSKPSPNQTSIYHLPVEILFIITEYIIKIDPTQEDIKGLFGAAATSFVIRQILEDHRFERIITKKFLGVHHSRNSEERRLGLEPNVAKRYKQVFYDLGFKDKHIKSLQDLADRNAKIYLEEGSAAYSGFITFRSDEDIQVLSEKAKELEEEEEEEEEEEPRKKKIKKERHISSWPWWYFRAWANRKNLESILMPYTEADNDNLFSMSVVSVIGMDSVITRRGPGTEFKGYEFTEGYSSEKLSFLLSIGRYEEGGHEWRGSWATPADLMIIPIDKLVSRALNYTYDIGEDMELKGSTQLVISISEPMPLHKQREGAASFRKEVIMTGLDNLPDTMVRHGPPVAGKATIHDFDLKIILQIQQAYLGKDWTTGFFGPQRKSLPYLHLKNLSLQEVYFENPAPLDLSAVTGKILSILRFGPSNLSQVPQLFCPSPILMDLHLTAAQDGILLWNLQGDHETCFRHLVRLHINGNVPIWNSSAVLKISKLPNLYSITLDNFTGKFEDLKRLGAILTPPRSGFRKRVTIWVRFAAPNKSLSVQGLDIFKPLKNVRFKDFYD